MDMKDTQTMSREEYDRSKFMKKSTQGRMFLDEEAVEDYFLMKTLAEMKVEREAIRNGKE